MNKYIFQQKLRRILPALVTALVVVLFLFIRYVAVEMPDWIYECLFLVYPLIILRLLDESNLLTDIILAMLMYIAVVLIPCQDPMHRRRKFLIRPMAAVAAYVLLAFPSWGMFNEISDTVRLAKNADRFHQVQEMIDDSEYVLLRDGGGHATKQLAHYLPLLTFKGDGRYDDGRPVYYARSAILIDTDEPSVAFCDYRTANGPDYAILEVPMKSAEEKPDYSNYRTRSYSAHRYQFVFYFSGEEGADISASTLMCFTVQLPDGSVWINAEPIDPEILEDFHMPYHDNVTFFPAGSVA